jgi:hypothetical protein
MAAGSITTRLFEPIEAWMTMDNPYEPSLANQ